MRAPLAPVPLPHILFPERKHLFTTLWGSTTKFYGYYSCRMNLINRQPAEELAYTETHLHPPTGRSPRERRPLSRLERFDLAKRRIRAFMLFSVATAGAASLLIYGAYLMTTRILL